MSDRHSSSLICGSHTAPSSSSSHRDSIQQTTTVGDFELVKTGDPLFVDVAGNVITYNGSHGDEIYLMFINEGGYYYAESGTGIGVAVRSSYSLHTGTFVSGDDDDDDEYCQLAENAWMDECQVRDSSFE